MLFRYRSAIVGFVLIAFAPAVIEPLLAAAPPEPGEWQVQTTRSIPAHDSTCSVRRGMLQVLTGRLASGERFGSVSVITGDPLYWRSKVLLDVDGDQFLSEGRLELTPRLLTALQTNQRAQIILSSPRGDRREATIPLDGFSEALDHCVRFLEH